MPRKIRELIRDLKHTGFYEISKAGKGSHRKYMHEKYAGAVTVSGKEVDDQALSRMASARSNSECKEMKTAAYYHKWVEWNEEDNVYIGKCPDLITGIHGDDHIQLW